VQHTDFYVLLWNFVVVVEPDNDPLVHPRARVDARRKVAPHKLRPRHPAAGDLRLHEHDLPVEEHRVRRRARRDILLALLYTSPVIDDNTCLNATELNKQSPE